MSPKEHAEGQDYGKVATAPGAIQSSRLAHRRTGTVPVVHASTNQRPTRQGVTAGHGALDRAGFRPKEGESESRAEEDSAHIARVRVNASRNSCYSVLALGPLNGYCLKRWTSVQSRSNMPLDPGPSGRSRGNA